MLTKLVVEDFQSHARTEIPIGPGCTTIIGSNDVGKTALFRALRLVCLNDAKSPQAYVRVGKKRLRVDLHVDGRVVTREKGGGVNLYALDGESYKFDSSRVRVPQAVADLVNVGRENFCLQHDRHFWLSDTPGEVSRRLNALVNLAAVDRTLKNVATAAKTARGEALRTRAELKEGKKKVKALAWAPRLAAAAERLEELGAAAESSQNRAALLRSSLETYRDTTRARKRLSGAYRAIAGVVQMGTTSRAIRVKIKRIKQLLSDLAAVERDAALPVPDLSRAVRLRAAGDAVAEKRRRLEYLLADYDAARSERCRLAEELAAVEKRLKETKKACPKCGRPLPS